MRTVLDLILVFLWIVIGTLAGLSVAMPLAFIVVRYQLHGPIGSGPVDADQVAGIYLAGKILWGVPLAGLVAGLAFGVRIRSNRLSESVSRNAPIPPKPD